MAPNIVTKFRLNSDDFKIFFDNEKKTHVAENMETGEKTNIGVLGIFLQMGIIKPEEDTERHSVVQRLTFLEDTVNGLIKKFNEPRFEEREEMQDEVKEESEEKPIKKKKLKFDVKEQIMERALEGIGDKEKKKDAKKESEEEIENWMDI